MQSTYKDVFYISFNVSLNKDEYLISNLLFQIEFQDPNLFIF